MLEENKDKVNNLECIGINVTPHITAYKKKIKFSNI